jgi:pimeloyl-ACP methyl ester carboxylesterase
MEPLRPPSPLGLLREGAGLLELPRLLLRLPELLAQPRGGGEAVLVLPGYGAGDASTAVLRGYLRRLGWDARGWGLGRNSGDVPGLVPRVADLVAGVARASGRRVRLVGWSLGGYLAREAARERPADVERVVTLGSPVVGGPKYTAVAEVYRRRGFDLDAIEAAVAERSRVPLDVPVTAVYSRSDGVVAWRACVDESPGTDHVEVRTTHLGLGFAPEVLCVVARALAGRDARERG